jgi:hypothetical protein
MNIMGKYKKKKTTRKKIVRRTRMTYWSGMRTKSVVIHKGVLHKETPLPWKREKKEMGIFRES